MWGISMAIETMNEEVKPNIMKIFLKLEIEILLYKLKFQTGIQKKWMNLSDNAYIFLRPKIKICNLRNPKIVREWFSSWKKFFSRPQENLESRLNGFAPFLQLKWWKKFDLMRKFPNKITRTFLFSMKIEFKKAPRIFFGRIRWYVFRRKIVFLIFVEDFDQSEISKNFFL